MDAPMNLFYIVDIRNTLASVRTALTDIQKRMLSDTDYVNYITELFNDVFSQRQSGFSYSNSVKFLLQLGINEEEALFIDHVVFSVFVDDLTKCLSELPFNLDSFKLKGFSGKDRIILITNPELNT